MHAIVFSAIVRAPRHACAQPRTARWGHAMPWLLTLVAGLPLLIGILHLISPDTPLVYLVVPALAGALVPATVLGPGQFILESRPAGNHQHTTISLLDAALRGMGYRRASSSSLCLRYLRTRPWLHQQEGAITVTIHERMLNISGPIGCLRLLQHRFKESLR